MFESKLQALKNDLMDDGASPEFLARINQLKRDLVQLAADDAAARMSSETQKVFELVQQIEILLRLGLVLGASRLFDELIDSTSAG
jgi:hypothetical protein